MAKELSKIEKEILKDIALKGERTIYDIAAKDRIASRSTVSKVLEKFQKLRFIEIKLEEPFPKIKGNIKRYYGLTFRGLVAALKIEGIKFHLIKSANDLIASWIEKVSRIDSILKLRQRFKIKAGWKTLENAMVDFVEQNPEQAAIFLKHYDLEFSDDLLIYVELLIHSASKIAAFNTLNRMKRRKFEKLLSIAPEFAGYFVVPQLWNPEISSDKHWTDERFESTRR